MAAVISESALQGSHHGIAAWSTKKRSSLVAENDGAKTRSSTGRTSHADWRPSPSFGSVNAIEPEIAVVLHYIVDEASDMTAKTCAVQMLIEARRSCLGDEELTDAYSATYYDLLSGAASACSAVASTPVSLGGNKAYTTLWRSALCGLIPSIIARLERVREAGSQSTPSSQFIGSTELVSNVALRLFERASQTLEQCGASYASRPAGQDKVDEDSVMLDALIHDDGPGSDTERQDFGAILLRSLADNGLIAPLDQGSTQKWPDTVMTAAATSTRSASMEEAAQSSLTLETMFEQQIASGRASEGAFLERFRDDYVAQAPLSNALFKQFKEWSLAAEVESLSHVCTALLEHDIAFHVWMMYISPISVMHALSTLLDDISQLPSGEDPSVLGAIILFAEVVVQLATEAGARYDQVLPRQANRLLPSILRTSAATKTLSHLTRPDQEIVGAWITSLFGSDGISDDLIRSSPPHMLLRVTPTIFLQIVAAAVADIVDSETLRGGLTYFLQDLLSYTLPGAIRSLLHNIERCHRTLLSRTLPAADRSAVERRKSVCFSVLCGLLCAENCPTMVKRLVAVHVVSCLDRCKPLLSDEVDNLRKDLNAIANAQQDVRRTDLWIKAAMLATASSASSSIRTTDVTLPGTMDALLNLNASLHSIATQRGPSAVSRLVGNMLRADAGTASTALQRSVASSFGLVALREYLDDPCGHIDLSQAAVVRILYDLAGSRSSCPSATAAAVLNLVRLLVATFTASGMQQHIQQHNHHQQQHVRETPVRHLDNAHLAAVADALAAVHALMATRTL